MLAFSAMTRVMIAVIEVNDAEDCRRIIAGCNTAAPFAAEPLKGWRR